MADISKITLPSGNTYNIKDAGARELIASLQGGQYFLGLTTSVLTDGSTTKPIVIGGNNITQEKGNIAVYGNAEFIWDGAKWVEFGDLSNLGDLAVLDTVTLSKGSGDQVLGEATTFSLTGGTTDTVLGSDATFTTTVTPTTTNIKATASGTTVAADGTAAAITGFGSHSTETFVKSVSADTTKKLVTTTVPNVTSAGSASNWSFAMGTGTDAETLVISGGNGTAPTLGTAKTVATGATATDGAGAAVVTDVTIGDSATAITALGTPSTSNCLTGVKVTAQPTVELATGATAGTGVVSVATGITSASTVTNNKDQVTAVTNAGSISVGTNDKVKVAKYDDLSVSVS